MRAKNDTQSLFHGDPAIWVITTLDPRAEGKTHIGKDGTSQVIDVIFEEKEKGENGEEKNKEVYGDIPPEFEPNDVRYQEWSMLQILS